MPGSEITNTTSAPVMNRPTLIEKSIPPPLCGPSQGFEAWFRLLAIVLVTIDLRPGFVSIGTILPAIRSS